MPLNYYPNTADAVSFKGITNWGESSLADQLETNLAAWLDWSLLKIGAFFNVTIRQSGTYGGDKSRLRPSDDPNYIAGQAWETFRPNLVYESGNYLYGIPPVQISGCWINGVFSPIADTGNPFYVSYPLGRIVFNNPIPTSSIVQMEYSYKAVYITTTDDPTAREVMFNSQRVDNPQMLQVGSGMWTTSPQARLPLPAVLVQTIPVSSKSFGYQIGLGSKVRMQVLFHTFAETSWDRKQLFSILLLQKDKTISLFDKNLAIYGDAMPLDYRGTYNPSGLMYPDLIQPSAVGGYNFTTTYFYETESQTMMNNPPLYMDIVRLTTETNLGNV